MPDEPVHLAQRHPGLRAVLGEQAQFHLLCDLREHGEVSSRAVVTRPERVTVARPNRRICCHRPAPPVIPATTSPCPSARESHRSWPGPQRMLLCPAARTRGASPEAGRLPSRTPAKRPRTFRARSGAGRVLPKTPATGRTAEPDIFTSKSDTFTGRRLMSAASSSASFSRSPDSALARQEGNSRGHSPLTFPESACSDAWRLRVSLKRWRAGRQWVVSAASTLQARVSCRLSASTLYYACSWLAASAAASATWRQIKDQSPLRMACRAGLLARCRCRERLDAGSDAAQARLASLLHSGALITTSVDCGQGVTGPVRPGTLGSPCRCRTRR